MKVSLSASTLLTLGLGVCLGVSGCSKKNNTANNETPQQNTAQQAPNAAAQQAINPGSASPTQTASPAPPPEPVQSAPPPPASYTIPAGTHVRVAVNQELGSEISQSGERFSATVVDPIEVRGHTIVRAGAPASGTVIEAKSLGHFKGQAELVLRLDTIRAEGQRYEVDSSRIERVEKGKGKRTAVMTGGGGGLGALIGGIAGGGKGALIGALAGAGAGATGSAFTGNHEIVIPAETRLTFRIDRPVRVSR